MSEKRKIVVEAIRARTATTERNVEFFEPIGYFAYFADNPVPRPSAGTISQAIGELLLSDSGQFEIDLSGAVSQEFLPRPMRDAEEKRATEEWARSCENKAA